MVTSEVSEPFEYGAVSWDRNRESRAKTPRLVWTLTVFLVLSFIAFNYAKTDNSSTILGQRRADQSDKGVLHTEERVQSNSHDHVSSTFWDHASFAEAVAYLTQITPSYPAKTQVNDTS